MVIPFFISFVPVPKFFRTNTVYAEKGWKEESVTPAYFCGCYEGDIRDNLDTALPELKNWLTQTLQAERQKQEEAYREGYNDKDKEISELLMKDGVTYEDLTRTNNK